MVPGSSGLKAGFGPSTPASPIPRGGSFRIRPGAPEEYRARYHHGAGLFWSKGRIRTVDTRVTNSPRGEFSNPPGGTRDLPSPVPLRCRALLVLELRRSMLAGRIKSKAPACRGSKRALLSEYVCGVRCADNKQPASCLYRNRRLNQYQSQKPKPSA